MKNIFEKMLEFIPSEAMRKHLHTAYTDGSLSLTAEDMLAVVYNSDNSLSERYEFIRSLSEHITEKEAYNTIIEAMELILSDFNKNGLYLSVIFFDDEDEHNQVKLYSLQEAADYKKKNNIPYLYCELYKADKLVVPEITFDKNGSIIDFRTTPYKDDFSRSSEEFTKADKLMDRYVYLPTPFKKGDVVVSCNDRRKKYIVVNADVPSPEVFKGLDVVDMSVMVVPYEYRNNLSSENISIHHEHLYTLTLDYAD